MKERPILFSGAMVRAIKRTEIPKNQTRPSVMPAALEFLEQGFPPEFVAMRENGFSPYGYAGERLWVRETWAQPAALDPGPTVYRADYPACVPSGLENTPPASAITWKPSIHVPSALSRLTLEITGVRVERLNDCSEADAISKGIRAFKDGWERFHTDPADTDQGSAPGLQGSVGADQRRRLMGGPTHGGGWSGFGESRSDASPVPE